MRWRSKNKKWREDPMRPASWPYDEKSDSYACPNEKTLPFAWESHATTELGYRSTVRVYKCQDCSDCPLGARCLKSKDPDTAREVRISPTLNAFKRRASEMLHTERGSQLRRQRSVDVETIFGDIKRNWHFDRFSLRGLKKVDHEFRLMAAGHNLRKLTLALAV